MTTKIDKSRRWKLVELKDVAIVESGGNAPQGEIYFKNGTHPFVRVQHFDGGKTYVDRFDFINEDAIKKYHLKKFDKNSIIFPKSGASIRLEKRAILPMDAYVVSHLCVVKPISMDGKFLYYILKNERFAASENGSTLPFLNISHIKRKQLYVPISLDEQKSIAHVLTTIQDAIAGQEELIAKLKGLKKSMMQHFFAHGIRGEKTKMTEIGEVPESWEVVKLGDICARKNVQCLPSKNGNKRYVGLEHIESGVVKIMKSGLEIEVKSSKVLFSSGDILYGKLRPYLDKAAIPDFDGLASTDIIVLSGEKVSNEFLIALLHSDNFLQYAMQTTSGVNHPRTSWESIKKYKFALPSEEQRESIKSAYWAITEKEEFAQEKLSNYQNLFKTLLHEMISGERSMKIYEKAKGQG